jgi:hypothetical protein
MIEAVFSDSAKGSLRLAKDYNGDGAVPGRPRDVVCIGHNLDIGDISGEFDGDTRRNEFVRLFGAVRFEDGEVERFFESQRADLQKTLLAAKNGEPIRAWKSSAPRSACAFAFLCDALRDIDCEFSVVALPDIFESPDGAPHSLTAWSEVPAGQFYSFLPLEREISAAEKRLSGGLWNELKAENAPLRALVNGRLISVPEDFYDHILIKNIPDGEFLMSRLIGTVLGKYALGVGDGWYALRLEKMIAANMLEVIADKDASRPYGKILKKI